MNWVQIFRTVRSEDMTEEYIKKKIEVVKDATKIFGKSSGRATQMLKEGKTKSEILKATGATVGVKQCIL